MTFEMHEAVDRELSAFIVGEWAVLARLEAMMPVEVALQRMLTTEDMLSFAQRQRGVANTVQTLERLAFEWESTSDGGVGIRAFRFDNHVGAVVGGA